MEHAQHATRLPSLLSYAVICLVLAAGCKSTNPATPAGERVSAPTAAARSTAQPAAAPAAMPAVMRVHFINVGQGDATLFEFPCAAVLVDTGGENNSQFDSTVELEAYLEEFFDRREDLDDTLTSLILSHPHIDHTRGVSIVRDSYAPQNVVTNGQASGSGGAQQRMIHTYAAEHETGPDAVGFQAIRLDDIDEDAGLTSAAIDPVDCGMAGDPVFTVLWGQVESHPSDWSTGDFNNLNNHSIVLRVDFGEASVLLTGDLEEEAIDHLIERYEGDELLDVDVYQVGHHGSRNGTTTDLVAAMAPEYAVFSMGPVEREASWTAWAYGHPRSEVVDMLQIGIATERDPIDVQVGLGAKSFEAREITQAVFATGWDGTVILEAGTDGVFRVVQPAQGGGPSLINVNTAPLAELDLLPLIGPAKAQAIIDHREGSGSFGSVDELDDVPGIGPATVEAVRPFVTVGA